MTNSRGSEWRKWDLHVHTASSYDYKDKANDANDKLVQVLLENEIAAIAITDHFVIDKNRIQQIREKVNGRITVFPGVELRCDKGTSNLHIILIFDEKADLDTLEEDFKVFKRNQGKSIADNERIYWDFNDVVEFAKTHNAIITIHAGKKSNGLDRMISNTLPHQEAIKEEIATNVDIFEMGRVADFDNYKKHVFPAVGVKPMIVCSDNHCPSEYPKDRYLWIKSDLTFSGLKQILFEPDERVCVQLEKPDYKAPFRVIDSISLDEKSFWNDTIYLNGNLNTIIGGRSTGKSTLLNAIARKLDCPIEKLTQKDGYNDYIEEHFSGVSIHWSDGQEDNTRDVDYYPQSYMYQIANDGKKLDRIICDNIMEDKKDAISKYIKNNNQLETDLHTTILSLFQEQEKYKALSSQLREKGNKSAISKEIGDLEIKVKSLTDQTQITEAEIERYKADTETLSQIEQKNNAIHRDITTLESLINTPILASNFPQKYDVLSENTREHLIKVYSNIAETANEQWVNQIKEILQTLHTEQGNNEQQYNTIKNTPLYIKCKQYYDNNKELNSIQTRLREEQKKLHEFEEQETICNKCKQEIDNLVKKIVDQYIQFQTNTNAVCRELSIKRNDLTIAAHTIFLRDDLYDFLKERFIIRSTEQQNYIEKLANKYAEQGTIEDYIRKALNSEIMYKSTHHAQEVMTALLSQNWYKYQFDVIYQDDKFTEMSQGKQAFVVLKLLLDFSKKQCPILIDQPEDSLDNRAIYKDLVEYIRNKKKERQIILVTHNPNVVVSADAENVIVANQNGNNSPNQNGVKFHYINGSLENSKDKNACVESILESQGIREHVCEILEGGKEAFEKREKKYGFR